MGLVVLNWPILSCEGLLILRMYILLILMTIYIIWLTHELSLIIIRNRSRHPRLLYNLPIINHSRRNSKRRLSLKMRHLARKHLIRALYHIELRRRGHIMVKMSMTINISLIWIKLRTVCNRQGPYILLVGNQMLRRYLIWLLRMRLSNNWVRVLSLGVLGRKIVIESVLYWVCLLTANW
jgi:hypothetical protein